MLQNILCIAMLCYYLHDVQICSIRLAVLISTLDCSLLIIIVSFHDITRELLLINSYLCLKCLSLNP